MCGADSLNFPLFFPLPTRCATPIVGMYSVIVQHLKVWTFPALFAKEREKNSFPLFLLFLQSFLFYFSFYLFPLFFSSSSFFISSFRAVADLWYLLRIVFLSLVCALGGNFVTGAGWVFFFPSPFHHKDIGSWAPSASASGYLVEFHVNSYNKHITECGKHKHGENRNGGVTL